MGVVGETLDALREMSWRQVALQVLSLGLIVSSALVLWKGLALLTGSESPVVVVLSGSMEPGFRKGDILFLNKGTAPVETGEIVVFNVDGRDVPIVHRVIQSFERQESTHVDLLTKGDNNPGNDRLGGLYAPGQLWVDFDHVVGRTVGFIPWVGQATIIMNEYPLVKFLLIGILGLMVVTSKE